MKKFDLILMFLLAVLLVAAFLPEFVPGVQAASPVPAVPAGVTDGAQAGAEGGVLSPAAYLVVGLMGLLFGGFSLLPLLCKNDANRRAGR